MKTSLKNSKRAAVLVTALALIFCASCGKPHTEQRRDYKAEAEAASVHCVSKADCYLCGDGNIRYKEYYSQNNVGVISLNTFELMPVEINRYDKSGQLIEENTGVMLSRSFKNGDDGFSAHLMLDADRGIANVDITPYGDSGLSLDTTEGFLCEDCLTEFAGELYGNAYGIGIINFSERKMTAFLENLVGFSAGDYYIHCDFDPQYGKIKTLIALAPLRYADDG